MNTYKNKNLIYVGGKGYKEQDLMDMITYYHDNYKPNLVFPGGWNEDVNEQIFKNYPFYSTISKNTKMNLYYEEKCNLDISFREFIHHIDEERPVNFYMLTIDDDDDMGTSLHVIHVLTSDEGIYSYVDTYINKYDGFIRNDEYEDTEENIIEYIIRQNSNANYLFFDFSTIQQIYNKRSQCITYNKNYADEMLKKYVDKLLSFLPSTITTENDMITYYGIYLFLWSYLVPLSTNSEELFDISEDFIDIFSQDVINNTISDALLTYNIKTKPNWFSLVTPYNNVSFEYDI